MLITLAACGDDDKKASDDDRRLSSLSTTEARELCEQFLDEVGDAEWRGVARLACMFAEAIREDG
jgi:hypothetical protein